MKSDAIFSYYLEEEKFSELDELGDTIFRLVCRTDFNAPGFALLRLSETHDSHSQRALIIRIKEMLSQQLESLSGDQLGWFTMNRFDQKNTTKPHRDGAPSDSLLILGYEPTAVRSELSMADYSRCAYDMGITPDQFLEEFNPMYEKGLEKLVAYTTYLREFDPSKHQIVVVNNSSNPLSSATKHWQGVLHSATIQTSTATSRVINSTAANILSRGEAETVSSERQREFLTASSISEPTYS